MSDMSKEELYDAVHSEFWNEVVEKLKKERDQLCQDILKMDFTTEYSKLEVIRHQAKIEMIDKVFELVADMKGTAKEAS